MLSQIGITELTLLFVIGLLILGPERLPRVASQLGRWIGKARRTANQLRFQMEREIALADIERTQKKRRDEQQRGDKTQAGAAASKTDGDADSGQAQPGVGPKGGQDSAAVDSSADRAAGSAGSQRQQGASTDDAGSEGKSERDDAA